MKVNRNQRARTARTNEELPIAKRNHNKAKETTNNATALLVIHTKYENQKC